ncbi:hypothetical protein FKP32DRAFT_1614383 [Trametes sanguinea]|nr:hypothetical protein FKP32DRAFT_1614383 [Trametes sanguinea]
MPRLQVSRRGSLMSTEMRAAFLEAFNRNVIAETSRTISSGVQGIHNATHSLTVLARRVQTDLKRVTGRFFPIYQVVASIHALKRDIEHVPTRSGSSSPPTPKPLQILITPTSPPAPPAVSGNLSSMSRRRLACNIPALQSHLSIPAPSFSSFLSPAYVSPSSSLRDRPLFTMSRRSSLSSGEDTGCPVTPIDQIVHTPLSPPKIPRAPPPPPRTWARLNAQIRGDDISPLASPGLPLTPYVLSPSDMGRPILHPLRIPITCTLAAGDAELRDNHLSPRAISPFKANRSSLVGGLSTISAAQHRPMPARNNSASSLSRAALLRASRPHLARSLSATGGAQLDVGCENPFSQLAYDAPPSPVSLASPFIIQSEDLDTEYFRF